MPDRTESVPLVGRATIVDVAKAAGVSRQTVSNVLNRPDKVAPDTLERVRAQIDALRFTPHVTAQQLRRRRASAFGFGMNPFTGNHGARRLGHVLDEFLVELTTAAPQHGSHLVTFSPDQDDIVGGYRAMLSTGLVDGFVLADTHRGDPRPGWLLGQGVRFVSFGRVWDHPDLGSWVDVDGRAGVRDAVLHLASEGYDRIGFLGWPSGSPVGDDRRAGWVEGLGMAGIAGAEAAEAAVQDLTEATTAAHRLLDSLAVRAHPTTRPALVCASDLLALGAMRAARARDLEPGRDVGVVGFDDSDVAEALQLTSVRQPLAQAADHAWRLVADHPPGHPPDPVLLTPTLTIRSTSVPTGPPDDRS